MVENGYIIYMRSQKMRVIAAYLLLAQIILIMKCVIHLQFKTIPHENGDMTQVKEPVSLDKGHEYSYQHPDVGAHTAHNSNSTASSTLFCQPTHVHIHRETQRHKFLLFLITYCVLTGQTNRDNLLLILPSQRILHVIKLASTILYLLSPLT